MADVLDSPEQVGRAAGALGGFLYGARAGTLVSPVAGTLMGGVSGHWSDRGSVPRSVEGCPPAQR